MNNNSNNNRRYASALAAAAGAPPDQQAAAHNRAIKVFDGLVATHWAEYPQLVPGWVAAREVELTALAAMPQGARFLEARRRGAIISARIAAEQASTPAAVAALRLRAQRLLAWRRRNRWRGGESHQEAGRQLDLERGIGGMEELGGQEFLVEEFWEGEEFGGEEFFREEEF